MSTERSAHDRLLLCMTDLFSISQWCHDPIISAETKLENISRILGEIENRESWALGKIIVKGENYDQVGTD